MRVEEQVQANGNDVNQVINLYKKAGRGPTLEEFKLTDSQLYTLLHKNGVRLASTGKRKGANNGVQRGKGRNYRREYRIRKAKARSADSRATRGVGKGSRIARRRALYKPAGGPERGGGRDALVYLGKAAERLIEAYSAGIPEAGAILGLVSLAVEALGGE